MSQLAKLSYLKLLVYSFVFWPWTLLPAQQTALEAQLQLLELYGFSGSILIEAPGGVRVTRGMGFANLEAGLENTSRTLYSVASLSKHFTAAAIFLLEQEDRLRTTDRLGQHWPDRLQKLREVTISQLLNHRSGLPFACGEAEPPLSRDGFLSCLEELDSVEVAAGRFEYSNAGYALLAALIQEVNGQSYPEFLRNRLLQPADMLESGFLDEEDRWPAERVAHQYTWSQDFNSELTHSMDWNYRGAADLVSNVVELSLWRAHLPQILGPESVSRLMSLAAFPASSTGQLGWCMEGTMTLGYNARWCGANGVQILVLSNQNYGLLTPAPVVAELIENAIFGGKPRLDWKPVPDALPQPSAWEGSYPLDRNAHLEIRAREGTLEVSARGQSALNWLLVNDPDRERGLNQTTLRVSRLGKALKSKDYTRAARLAGDPEMAKVLETWLGGLESKLGRLERIEVIGTIPQGAGSRTYIELGFAEGSEVRRLRWLDNQLLSILPAGLPLAPVRFVPVASDHLVGYHLGFPGRGPIDLKWIAQKRSIQLQLHGRQRTLQSTSHRIRQ